MADYQNLDLGRIMQTAEVIKGMRREGENDKLRNAYLGEQIANSQQSRQIAGDAATRAQQEYTSKVTAEKAAEHYRIADAVERSEDPIGFVKQHAPSFITEYDAAHGQGSFESLTPEQLKQMAGGIKNIAAAHAGIDVAGTPEQRFAAGTAETVAGVAHKNRLEEIAATGAEARKTAADKEAEAMDPESVENTAQMIAGGQIPVLSGYALRTKWGQAVISRVREIKPDFAGQDYGSTSAALKQFTSGKNGNTIRSLNVAVQHLDQLSQLATALNNGDMQFVNRAANAWAAQTGGAAPTSFNAAKKVVGDEIVKAIVGAGGGVSDREEAAKSIDAANSPEQLAKTIETYQGLMAGQLNGLRQQYKVATGRDDFESMLLPETRARLESHGAGDASDASKPISPEEAAKLPPGTRFTGTDGVTRVKH
jgi:hypothetical protein